MTKNTKATFSIIYAAFGLMAFNPAISFAETQEPPQEPRVIRSVQSEDGAVRSLVGEPLASGDAGTFLPVHNGIGMPIAAQSDGHLMDHNSDNEPKDK